MVCERRTAQPVIRYSRTAADSIIMFHGVPPPLLRKEHPSSAVVAVSAIEAAATFKPSRAKPS